MIVLPALVVLCALYALAVYLERRDDRARKGLAGVIAKQLEYVLTLIQGVQKHRGLSGQDSASALRQREQLASQLDRQWADWERVIGVPLDARRAPVSWQGLRTRPTDFAYHCELIDELLRALGLLERSLLATKKQGDECVPTLTARCREIEDLGRVRGLSVRAAGQMTCPIDMAVPLRYLCRRLREGRLHGDDPAVAMALREIGQKLLDAPRVAIAPERCFELLTPSIDRALAELRQALPQAHDAAARDVRRNGPVMPVGAYGAAD